ncbi:MAG: hypothetical protein K0Q49_1338 [Haloplasmataceae bacterium]|jgi:hypothetical protein|nr:hypothetical protein [Haloplasmataceae bacterium]
MTTFIQYEKLDMKIELNFSNTMMKLIKLRACGFIMFYTKIPDKNTRYNK